MVFFCPLPDLPGTFLVLSWCLPCYVCGILVAFTWYWWQYKSLRAALLAAPAGSAAVVAPAGTVEGGPCLLVLEERILPRNQPLVPRAGACSAAVATAWHSALLSPQAFAPFRRERQSRVAPGVSFAGRRRPTSRCGWSARAACRRTSAAGSTVIHRACSGHAGSARPEVASCRNERGVGRDLHCVCLRAYYQIESPVEVQVCVLPL